MTPKEAVEHLKSLLEDKSVDWSAEDKTAVNVAIEALEQIADQQN